MNTLCLSFCGFVGYSVKIMSFLSDSSDDGAVEDLLNQAMDNSILDQIAKINCSSFSSDSVLPTHIENRFSRLKSFPLTNPKSQIVDPQIVDFEQKPAAGETESKTGSTSDYFCSKSTITFTENRIPKKGKELGSWSVSSPSSSVNSSTGSPLGVVKSKSSSQSPKKSGCFWCSVKWGFGKNSKEKRGMGNGEEFVSDLSVFSERKQQKLVEKMLREEDKINRETEKIVNLVKQGSATINIPDIR